jgi:hypothetical protein
MQILLFTNRKKQRFNYSQFLADFFERQQKLLPHFAFVELQVLLNILFVVVAILSCYQIAEEEDLNC